MVGSAAPDAAGAADRSQSPPPTPLSGAPRKVNDRASGDTFQTSQPIGVDAGAATKMSPVSGMTWTLGSACTRPYGNSAVRCSPGVNRFDAGPAAAGTVRTRAATPAPRRRSAERRVMVTLRVQTLASS